MKEEVPVMPVRQRRATSKPAKKPTEQVHDEGGHKEFVASCRRCQSEAEQDRNAAAARAELAAGEQDTAGVREDPAGHDGPLPDADPAGYPADAVDLPVEPARRRRALTTDGRPKCHVHDCPLPEFSDDIGLCGAHWSTRPDLRKVARGD